MVCPTCGLDNDPRAAACARCNTTLNAAPRPSGAAGFPRPPAAEPSGPPDVPRPGGFPPPAGNPASPPAPSGSPASPLAPTGSPASPLSPAGSSASPLAPSGDRGFPQPPPQGYQPPRRNLLPIIAGVSVVVLILLVVGFVVYRDRTPEPAAIETRQDTTITATTDPATPATDPTPPPPEPEPEPAVAADPRQQAGVIDAVLGRSGTSRDKLNSAIERIGGCRDLTGALADMREVGEERTAQLAEVRAAELSAVPNGETIRSTLAIALQHSLDADAAFVEWAEPTISGGCANNAARRSAYARGQAASTRAGTAKETFLAQWNPVATGLGLPARTRQRI